MIQAHRPPRRHRRLPESAASFVSELTTLPGREVGRSTRSVCFLHRADAAKPQSLVRWNRVAGCIHREPPSCVPITDCIKARPFLQTPRQTGALMRPCHAKILEMRRGTHRNDTGERRTVIRDLETVLARLEAFLDLRHTDIRVS
jgi:hypothetical protein